MRATEDALMMTRMNPLPTDIDERLARLRPDIPDLEWDWVQEALALAQMEQGDFNDDDEIEGGPDANT